MSSFPRKWEIGQETCHLCASTCWRQVQTSGNRPPQGSIERLVLVIDVIQIPALWVERIELKRTSKLTSVAESRRLTCWIPKERPFAVLPLKFSWETIHPSPHIATCWWQLLALSRCALSQSHWWKRRTFKGMGSDMVGELIMPMISDKWFKIEA